MKQVIKAAFLREVNMKSWDEAKEKYPNYTTTDKLSAFRTYNFQHGNRPAALVAFAQAARQSVHAATPQTQEMDAFVGLIGSCKGYVLTTDVLKVDDNIIKQKTENFKGFNLAILDFPEVPDVYFSVFYIQISTSVWLSNNCLQLVIGESLV